MTGFAQIFNRARIHVKMTAYFPPARKHNMKLYGIPNCNTVKKARTWLAEHQIDMPFHDFKKNGVDAAMLEKWCAHVGHEKLLNRQGTTWRQLPDEVKNSVTDQASAIQLLLEKPSAIKRPVLEHDKGILLGFDAAAYAQLFKQ